MSAALATFFSLFDQQSHWNWIITHWPYSNRILFSLGSGIVHSGVFWGLNAMFYFLHKTEIFYKYKIARKKEPSPELVKKCLRDILINHAVVQWIGFYGIYSLFILRGMDPTVPPPSWLQILYETIISFVINDFLFYWVHRTFHHPKLYARFHKQHHKFNSTIGIAAEYAGPVESIFANSIPTLAGPILLGMHPYSFWIYLGLRVWETVESHSGYDFPWSIWSLFDWQGGAEAHDFHHSVNIGNYGGVCFSFWDTLMGTDKAFRRFLEEKKNKQKKQ